MYELTARAVDAVANGVELLASLRFVLHGLLLWLSEFCSAVRKGAFIAEFASAHFPIVTQLSLVVQHECTLATFCRDEVR